MKKRLEADLMSIAHRILKIKDKSDIDLLCIETRRLYEKLSVLRFVEEHFANAKPTIDYKDVEVVMEQFFENNFVPASKEKKEELEIIVEKIVLEENVQPEPEVEDEDEDEVSLEEEQAEDEKAEEMAAEEEGQLVPDFEETEIESEEESEEEIIADETVEFEEAKFQPIFELDEEEEVVSPKKIEEIQISFIDLLGGDYNEPQFIKVDHSLEKSSSIDFDIPKTIDFQEEELSNELGISRENIDVEPKTVSLNEKLSKGLSIDLNDRIAFVKNLFGNSDEDYNRVLNQLITYDTLEEAQNFIDDMVKPDYNDWEGKEDYAQRFMEIIEKKFA